MSKILILQVFEVHTKVQLMEKEDILNKTSKDESQTTEHHLEEQTDLFVVIPPDGGWGWMVVLAAFFSFLISDGIIYTFGIFLTSMAESFHCSTSRVALTGAIMTGFFCFAGPFVAALVNQFGCRKIAIVGSLIASLSCILTSISTSLYLTFLTHGIMGGMGFGMIYIPAVIAVGFYFERWRALATGISVCGAGIGGIALPPLLSSILDDTGWRSSFRIMSVLSFGCTLWALLYRPLKPIKIESVMLHEKTKNDKSFFDRFHNKSHPTISRVLSKNKSSGLQVNRSLTPPIIQTTDGDLRIQVYSALDAHGKLHGTTSEAQGTSTVTIFRPHKLPRNISSEFIMSSMSSTSSRSSFRSKHESYIEKNVDSRLSTVYEEGKGKAKGRGKLLDCLRCSSCKNCNMGAYCKRAACFCCRLNNTNANTTARPLYRDDIFYSASLMFLPEYRKSLYVSQPKIDSQPKVAVSAAISAQKSSLGYNMLVTRTMTQKEINENKICTLCSESVKRTLATMLDFSLLKSPSFLLLVFNAIFTSLGFYTPYMFIKDRAIQNGVPKQLAFWLISGIGVTNTLGRIACGIISSFPNIRAVTISYSSLMMGGMATLLSGLSYNIWVQFGYAAVFGTAVACMSALRTIIIVEMLGLQKLTNAIGIILMFQGVASLAGTSISGLLRDVTGDYQLSFYFAGGCMCIGSFVLMPIRKVAAWEKQQKEELTNLKVQTM